jgi:hypothetical protein
LGTDKENFILRLAAALPGADPEMQTGDGKTVEIFWVNPYLSILIRKDGTVSVADLVEGEDFHSISQPELLPYVLKRYDMCISLSYQRRDVSAFY